MGLIIALWKIDVLKTSISVKKTVPKWRNARIARARTETF